MPERRANYCWEPLNPSKIDMYFRAVARAYLKEASMSSLRSYVGALMTATLLIFVSVGQPASAITAELAKKCRGMAFKEHPPVRAGSKQGAAKAQQEYYRACVAKDGKME